MAMTGRGSIQDGSQAATEAQRENAARTFSGQQRLATRLPREFRSGQQSDVELAGVVYGESLDNDDPYSVNGLNRVSLPPGWKVKRLTEWWFALLDDKDRERAKFFVPKFYDIGGRAYIQVLRRFGISDEPGDAQGNSMPYGSHTHFMTVVQACGKTIHVISVRPVLPELPEEAEGDPELETAWRANYEADKELIKKHRAEAGVWLNEHYPNWKDHTAYWN